MNHDDDDSSIALLAALHPYVVAVAVTLDPLPAPRARINRRFPGLVVHAQVPALR